MNQVIIDVREEDEFLAEHVENSINIPLSSFAGMAPGVLNQLGKSQIVIMCRSGVRAGQALNMIQGLGFNDLHQYQVYEGGILGWKKQGQPVVARKVKAPLPLMRQVQLVIGAMLLAFGIAAAVIDPVYAWGAVFIGCGLLVAGATGFCALANVLAMLPWNKGDTMARQEMCRLGKE
jgi:rhodanese-related sulfurtransferase